MDITGDAFVLSKRRAVKEREHIDDKFLRRSKRNAAKQDGFKNNTLGIKNLKRKEKEVPTPVPLAIISPQGTPVAPHLNKDVVMGISAGFLQIQPAAVSAAILKADTNDKKK